MQNTQTVEFAVTKDKRSFTGIGKTGILLPKTNFNGGTVNGTRTSQERTTTE